MLHQLNYETTQLVMGQICFKSLLFCLQSWISYHARHDGNCDSVSPCQARNCGLALLFCHWLWQQTVSIELPAWRFSFPFWFAWQFNSYHDKDKGTCISSQMFRLSLLVSEIIQGKAGATTTSLVFYNVAHSYFSGFFFESKPMKGDAHFVLVQCRIFKANSEQWECK